MHLSFVRSSKNIFSGDSTSLFFLYKKEYMFVLKFSINIFFALNHSKKIYRYLILRTKFNSITFILLNKILKSNMLRRKKFYAAFLGIFICWIIRSGPRYRYQPIEKCCENSTYYAAFTFEYHSWKYMVLIISN